MSGAIRHSPITPSGAVLSLKIAQGKLYQYFKCAGTEIQTRGLPHYEYILYILCKERVRNGSVIFDSIFIA
jgi:hypothetical protein